MFCWVVRLKITCSYILLYEGARINRKFNTICNDFVIKVHLKNEVYFSKPLRKVLASIISIAN